LFRRINKTISKNQKTNVGDEDLNKVRAYIVQSKSARVMIVQVRGRCRPSGFSSARERNATQTNASTVRRSRSSARHKSSRGRRRSSRTSNSV